MDYVVFMEALESADDILDEFQCLLFWEESVSVDVVLQVASLAILAYQV